MPLYEQYYVFFMILRPTKKNIELIASALRKAEVVALPTDTLYALSADASNSYAVQQVYSMKQRARLKALPIFCTDIAQVETICLLSPFARKLAEEFWPGALTLILPIKEVTCFIAPDAYPNDTNVAVRIPDSEMIRELIRILGKPLTATSANLSGQAPGNDPQEIASLFGDSLLILDDKNRNAVGVASTIVKPGGNSIEIIREGRIPSSQLLIDKYL